MSAPWFGDTRRVVEWCRRPWRDRLPKVANLPVRRVPIKVIHQLLPRVESFITGPAVVGSVIMGAILGLYARRGNCCWLTIISLVVITAFFRAKISSSLDPRPIAIMVIIGWALSVGWFVVL